MKSRRVSPVKIGAFVVVGVGLLVAGILLVGSGRWFHRTHPFVSYFDGSVNGLRSGAAVKFKGVVIGMVDRIRIPEGLTNTDQPIAVFFSLDAEKLDATGRGDRTHDGFVQDAIGNGLRAQLEAESLLTGILFVSLAFLPESEARLHSALEGVPEIPTIAPPLQEVGAAMRSIVDRIDRYPFEKVLDSLREALQAFTDLSRAPELRSSLASLDKALQGAGGAVARLEQQIDPLARSIGEGADSAKVAFESVRALSDEVALVLTPLRDSLTQTSERLQTMAVALEAAVEASRILLDPSAPLAVELRKGLREIGETARAARALVELLERNPSALVRGRGTPQAEDR